jgi:F-type H+-transporting ATPase subunit b
MTHLMVLAEGGVSGTIEDIARTFGVDWPQLISQIISFCIVSILLYKFAYKRVLAMLAVRRQQIAQGLANAAQIKAELARTEAQRQEVLHQANLRATRLIEEAHAAAARVQERETQKAIAAAEQLLQQAREAAAQDHRRMLGELKREVGRLVVQAATRATGKILTLEDQQRLTEETARVVTE